MRTRTLVGLALVFACRLAAAPGDDPVVTVETASHYYEIAGETAEQLRAAMDRTGPFDDAGTRHDAHTRWYVGWNLRCQPTRLVVTLKVTTTLPRWTDQFKAPRALSEQWNRYLDALRVHEAVHQDMARRTADRTSALRKQLAPRPTCDQLVAAMSAMAKGLTDEGQRADVQYDKETDHGRTQGASFP
jgi:predicted secreted Zn-dependent protease